MAPSPEPQPVQPSGPVLVDTGVWTWVRDRRFPHLATWFNGLVQEGLVLVCDLVVLELVRMAPNAARAAQVADQLALFASISLPPSGWRDSRATQLLLAGDEGAHRRVPPVDLLIAETARAAAVPLLHYDRDYERIGSVTDLDQRWFVPDGSLRQPPRP